jgi:ornithine lipid ester-linked acyl 2-hydroxylase
MKAFFNQHQDLYNQKEPPIYDCSKIPEVAIIEENFDIFKEELFTVLNNEQLKYLAFRKNRYQKSPNWKQIELLIYGVHHKEKQKLFPKTYGILSKIDGVATIYFSVLDKNSGIKAHNGDTDAFYRIHLGMKIPDTLPACGIEIGGNQRAWEEGKCIAFNDIYYRKAWNYTDSERIVLIIDLMLPQHRANKQKINAGVIATLILSRSYLYVGFLIELLPRILTRLIHPIIHFAVRLYFSLTSHRKKNKQ